MTRRAVAALLIVAAISVGLVASVVSGPRPSSSASAAGLAPGLEASTAPSQSIAAAPTLTASLVAGTSLTATMSPASSPVSPIRIGAVFPLTGNAWDLAAQQLDGVRAAAALVNADGGVAGRPVELVVRDLERAADAPAVMAGLRAEGVEAVVGAYSSDLSIAASAAADAEGLVYWEAGAVADRLTGRGLPLVFRVGATGAQLGANSARFTATELAPRLHLPLSRVRVAIVSAHDEYAGSVADAAGETASAAGITTVLRLGYDLVAPDWRRVMATLAAWQPDVIVLASHIPDGIAFRQQMLAAGLSAKALIGSTMAQCSPDFAADLGADAVGIFASDRPTGGFDPGVLDPAARATYDRLATALAHLPPLPIRPPGAAIPSPMPSDAPEYPITGPDLGKRAGPTEEILSGYTAGWSLFHHILPVAASRGDLTATGIAAAARTLDLPSGALPNGAGLHFSTGARTLGQNERATAVIWQWQAVQTYAFVWPPEYATGPIAFVPLGR